MGRPNGGCWSLLSFPLAAAYPFFHPFAAFQNTCKASHQQKAIITVIFRYHLPYTSWHFLKKKKEMPLLFMKGSTHTRKELDIQPVIGVRIKIHTISEAFSLHSFTSRCPECWLLQSLPRYASFSHYKHEDSQLQLPICFVQDCRSWRSWGTVHTYKPCSITWHDKSQDKIALQLDERT